MNKDNNSFKDFLVLIVRSIYNGIRNIKLNISRVSNNFTIRAIVDLISIIAITLILVSFLSGILALIIGVGGISLAVLRYCYWAWIDIFHS